MRNYSDLDSCIESLKSCGATYYTRDIITNATSNTQAILDII